MLLYGMYCVLYWNGNTKWMAENHIFIFSMQMDLAGGSLVFPFLSPTSWILKTHLSHITGYQCLFILIDKINKSTFQEICSAVNFLDI